MTVSSTIRRIGPFNGNDVTTAFPFTIKVFEAADIEITHTDADDAQSVLVLDSDYSVSLNADQDNNPGGTITYPMAGDPLATGESLVGVTVLDYEQPTDISNLGNFLPQVFEDLFDRVVILIQQLSERFARTLSYPVGDTASGTLPSIAERAGGSLAFDGSGNPIAGPALGDLTEEVAAAAASAEAAASSATSVGAQVTAATAQATIATTQAGLAAAARVAAEDAESGAETARDAALAAALIYVDTTAGLAATASGGYFYVPSAVANESLILYRDNAGVAQEIKRFLSAPAIAELDAAIATTTVSYGTTATSGDLGLNANVYGLRVPYTGVLKSINIRTSASGAGRIAIARREHNAGFTHEIESVTAATVAAAGVNTIAVDNIAVNKGDIVMFGMTAGGGVSYKLSGTEGGVILASPTVGMQFLAATGTLQPSMTLDIVQYAFKTDTEDDVDALESGVGSSFALVSQTFGDTSAGSGAAAASGVARGPTASAPAGVLTSVSHRTTSLSQVIDYLIAIYAPIDATGYNHTLQQLLTVSALTDSAGLATVTADDFGPVYVRQGSYIHVIGADSSAGPASYTAPGDGRGRSQGSYTITTAALSGTDSVQWFDVPVAMSFTIATTDVLALDDRLDDSESFEASLSTAVGTENLKVGLLCGEFDGSSHTAQGGWAIPRDGTITEFTVNLTAAGTGALLYCKRLNANRYRIVSRTAHTTSTNGVNRVTGLSIDAKSGDLLAYVTITGGFLRNNANTGDGIGLVTDTNLAGGLARVGTVYNTALQFTLRTVKVAPLGPYKGGKMLAEAFTGTTLPTGWSTSGGSWTVNDGLTPPAVGGYNFYAIAGEWSSAAKRTISARIKINSADTVAGLIGKADSGALLVIDGAAGFLRVRNWTPSFTSSAVKSVALPAALTVGREYVISVVRNGMSCSAKFYDTVTQATCSLTWSITDGFSHFGGFPGVIFVSGTTPPEFKWVGMDAPYPVEPRTLVLGDSNAEGSSALLAGASPWPALLAANSAAGDVLVAAQSGETSNLTYRDLNDLERWRPRYVVVALGTNDASQNFWRAHLSLLLAKIESLGAEPILCTVIPKPASQAIRTAMNVDIKARYFGPYRYIDFAAAVSTGNDGVTLAAAMYVGDGVHLSAAGQAACYAQLLADAPFLLW